MYIYNYGMDYEYLGAYDVMYLMVNFLVLSECMVVSKWFWILKMNEWI